ncbi:hypothetical protein EAG_04885 [Camponotus floridanus]|uniref:Uncharacterized protein n=1 Tax=Camponotus floridanus TaxID=104421 RepID=E2ASZ5_CAMFO|nr:hypothetical protein EAG_04885 [Camponotus floridanus]
MDESLSFRSRLLTIDNQFLSPSRVVGFWQITKRETHPIARVSKSLSTSNRRSEVSISRHLASRLMINRDAKCLDAQIAVISLDRNARPTRKKVIGGVAQISARLDVIEKSISNELVLGHEEETIRLMNRSLYRLTPVETDWLRVSSNLSMGRHFNFGLHCLISSLWNCLFIVRLEY